MRSYFAIMRFYEKCKSFLNVQTIFIYFCVETPEANKYFVQKFWDFFNLLRSSNLNPAFDCPYEVANCYPNIRQIISSKLLDKLKFLEFP